jgi:cytochrome P450
MTVAKPTEQRVPEHVPAELVRDIDINKFAAEFDDPYLGGARLHDGPDIFWATTAANGHPGWVLTRHALVQEAYLDPERFSSERSDLAALGITWKLNPLEFDPPEHYKYRRNLNPLFTPRAVSEMDKPVQVACDELIGEFAERGSCEFISEFAEKFPSYIFLDLMGMPRDMLPQFLDWERNLMRAEDPREKVGAMMSVFKYLEKFIEAQRKQPTTELMKTILAGKYEERPLTNDEVLGMVALLYIGGLDTVYSALGWIFHHLAGDQVLQEKLRANPELVPQAVEEFLRVYPVAQPHRKIKHDIEFHGVKMRKGDHVLMATFAAHRDPRAFDNPHQVDIDRKPRHLAFASGPHLCLGIHLARRELKTVITTFLSNCKNIRIPAGEKYQFHTGGTWGVDRLPLKWDRVKAA